MAGGGGNRKRFQFCTDLSGQEILYFRALQGHSGRNPIDPTLQDNVLIPNTFFEYIYHIGCAVSLLSITNSGLIPGGQNSRRERQTVFFIAVNPMLKNHIDPQDKHTRLLLNPVKKPQCLETLRDSQHPEQLTCTSKDQEHGSMEYLQAQGWVFLGSQQLPPRHVDVVGRFFLASRKWSAAELHAPLTWWPHRKSMH